MALEAGSRLGREVALKVLPEAAAWSFSSPWTERASRAPCPAFRFPTTASRSGASDSRHLYVYRRGERPLKMWLYDVDTGQKQPWREFAYDGTFEAIRVRSTPDGRAWTSEGRRIMSTLYVVEGLQ